MHTHVYSLVDRVSGVECGDESWLRGRAAVAQGQEREKELAHFPRSVQAWLDGLPVALRGASESRLDELGDQIVYGQLRDPLARKRVRRSVHFVVRMAQGYVDGVQRERFVEVLRTEPRLVELGLLMALSQLALTQQIPRDQEFYPAVLFDREVLSVVKHVAERDQPAVALLWKLVGLHEPQWVCAMEASLASVERGFAKTTRWPSRQVAAGLCALLSQVANVWASLGQALIVATEQADGILPMFAVENLAKPHELSRVDRAFMVDSINRRRQKHSVLDLLRRATAWPTRVSAILGNLAGDYGSLRLYGAYLQAVLTGVLKIVRHDNTDATSVLEHAAEVIERDIAYPIVAGIDTHSAHVTLFEQACSYDVVRKKRLSRQRERCLRGGVVIMEEDWTEMLRDIGSSYQVADDPRLRREPSPESVSRGAKRVVVK